MKPRFNPLKNNRAAAIQNGTLIDITRAANLAEIGMPTAITPALWRAIADDDRLYPKDPRLICLCWGLFLTLMTESYTRELITPRGRTLWFESDVMGRKVRVKAVAHAGDQGDPVATLMPPEEHAFA